LPTGAQIGSLARRKTHGRKDDARHVGGLAQAVALDQEVARDADHEHEDQKHGGPEHAETAPRELARATSGAAHAGSADDASDVHTGKRHLVSESKVPIL
jgi:hypothetical protein